MTRLVTVLLVLTAVGCATSGGSEKDDQRCRAIAQSLERIDRIKVGSTRADLLIIFEPSGGFYGQGDRPYVYRECRFIRVDVQFEMQSGAPPQSKHPGERPTDKIARVSRPYLSHPTYD